MGNTIRKGKSVPQGVKFDPRDGRFQARMQVNGKCIHLGMFASADEASTAYRNAKAKIDPECRAAAVAANDNQTESGSDNEFDGASVSVVILKADRIQ